jgi:hypothetical protein
MTFIQDPLHKHSLATIPECQSWSELGLDDGDSRDSVSVGEFESSNAFPASDSVSTSENEAPLRLGRMKKHFSASTISSELKRTSKSVGRMNFRTRTRSSTWPSYACSRLNKENSRGGESRVVN